MLKRTGFTVVALLSVGVAATLILRSGTPRDGRSNPSFQVWDSAGVQFIDLGTLDPSEIRPSLEAGLVWSSNANGIELVRVADGRLVDSGRVVVGDAGSRRVLYLDRDGQVERRVGGEGEGPGEFRALSSLHYAQGDVWVYDARLQRLSQFDTAGALQSTRRLAGPNPAVDLRPITISGASTDRLLATYGSVRRFGGEGIRRDTVPLLSFDLDAMTVDTIGLWPGPEWSYGRSERGSYRTYVGFSRELIVSDGGEVGLVGHTRSLELAAYSADGRLVSRLMGQLPAIRVEEADVERWRTNLINSLRASAPPSIVERFEQAPFRDTYPAYHHHVLGGDGRIWVGLSVRLGVPRRSWLRISLDPSPRLLALELPVDEVILDAAGSLVLTLKTDALDVESVRLMEVAEQR